MGSCFSTTKTFQGEGRTLNDTPAAAPAVQSRPSAPSNAGQRLGGAGPPSSASASQNAASSGTTGTSDADREARARAAERRMSQQAAKGTPAHGKLSKQLEQQKNAPAHTLPDDQDAPSRVVWD